MNLTNLNLLMQTSNTCNGSQSIPNKNIDKEPNNKRKKFISQCDILNTKMFHTNSVPSKKISVYNDNYFKPEKSFHFNSPIQTIQIQRKNIFPKEKFQNGSNLTRTINKNDDRQMPKLKKENDVDSRPNLQSDSPILNQRYQNVLRFPNYRQRKKCAFEKKLRRCGVELDGEVTVANLRKILQPYICKEINSILDKYIEVYFKKAIRHIQENVNLTSENWSETLKCSISKSLYKQYCDKANVDPFTSSSIAEDDFQYFKTSQKINHKINDIHIDHFVKSEVDNSTGHTSDSNSRCSYFTISEGKLEIDQDLNTGEISSCSEHISEYHNDHVNGNAEGHIRRKRKRLQGDRLDIDNPQNYLKFQETCSYRKYPPQSYSTDPYLSHFNNNLDSLILQKRKESHLPITAGFENNGQSYFLVRKPSEHSSNETDVGNYLNTLNSMTTKITNDSVYPNNYHCRHL